tara:strand:+ start:8 stop:1486 length:1479 start_codon:yes stop_codon:yes gene_type:complete
MSQILPRIYCASIATETNTFSKLITDLSDFKNTFFAEPKKHPPTPTLCSAIFPLLRNLQKKKKIRLTEGTATWAEPGGLINSKTWNFLKNKVLNEIKNAGNLDIILLGLHGAMISNNCNDCEADLIDNIRQIVGTKIIIGATFDPHSHISNKILKNLNIITVFKKFPHTDYVETARECIKLSIKTFENKILPIISIYDVRMITILPTNKNPMKKFINKIKKIEKNKNVLSISIIHGFMAGDSPDLGAKIITIMDKDQKYGKSLSKKLGDELFSMRKNLAPKMFSANTAVLKAKKLSKNCSKPVLIADIWDNPGGGVAGDSTILIKKAITMDLKKVAVGSIWDPLAVNLCHEAGEGQYIDLKFGSKSSLNAGGIIKERILVKKIAKNVFQKFGKSLVPLGNSASIEFKNLEIVLNTNRSQAFSIDIFTLLGIDIKSKKILIIKSTNHFYNSFFPFVSNIIYASVNGIYPNNPKKNNYKNLKRKIWPIYENPFK